MPCEKGVCSFHLKGCHTGRRLVQPQFSPSDFIHNERRHFLAFQPTLFTVEDVLHHLFRMSACDSYRDPTASDFPKRPLQVQTEPDADKVWYYVANWYWIQLYAFAVTISNHRITHRVLSLTYTYMTIFTTVIPMKTNCLL